MDKLLPERDEEREEEFYIDIVNEAVSYSFQILSEFMLIDTIIIKINL